MNCSHSITSFCISFPLTFCASMWDPSQRRGSSMTFFTVSPSHRLHFSRYFFSMGTFHRVQSFRSRLLQHGSLPQCHRSYQQPSLDWASHRVTAYFSSGTSISNMREASHRRHTCSPPTSKPLSHKPNAHINQSSAFLVCHGDRPHLCFQNDVLEISKHFWSIFVPKDKLPLDYSWWFSEEPEAEICSSEVGGLYYFICFSHAPQSLTSKCAGLLKTKFLLTDFKEFLSICKQWLQKGTNPYCHTWQHVKNISLTQSRNLPENPHLLSVLLPSAICPYLP